ncbi:MAG: DUF2804 family protein [Chitinophagales bacterium]|nr:DUF2804 family protein [Chitinophagales bacterium]
MILKERIASFQQNNQLIPFGVYDDLITNVDTSFWDKQGLLLKKRRTERKAWTFLGYTSEDLFAGFAIADAGLTTIAFAYFYIPSENLFVEDKINIPFSFSDDFNPTLTDDWKVKDYSMQTHRQILTAISNNSKFNIEFKINLNDNGVSVMAPSKDRPFNFTYKNLALPTQVKINHQGKVYHSEGNFGGIDFTKGYPPRSTKWNWLSMIGTTESGKSIAVNLVNHFNDNLENIMWLNDERIILSDASFQNSKPLDKNPWQIKTDDGILDISFTPFGARKEDINFVMMKSWFIQPYGKFSGTIQFNNNKEAFTAFGVVEDHIALW